VVMMRVSHERPLAGHAAGPAAELAARSLSCCISAHRIGVLLACPCMTSVLTLSSVIGHGHGALTAPTHGPSRSSHFGVAALN
jgi:hypothetical protein